MTDNVFTRRRLLAFFSCIAAWFVGRTAPSALATPHDEAGCGPIGPTTTYTFDDRGRIISITRTVR